MVKRRGPPEPPPRPPGDQNIRTSGKIGLSNSIIVIGGSNRNAIFGGSHDFVTETDGPVIILALETSLAAGSVALFDGENLREQVLLDPARRSAQTLAPAIERLLKSSSVRPVDVNLVAVSLGPGSFTGLRVGVTTAKTFAYAAGCEILGLCTLDVIAAQAPPAIWEQATELASVVDAQRKELFVAHYRRLENSLTRIGELRIAEAHAWLAELVPGTAITGPGVARLEQRLPGGVAVVESIHREPRAATLGRLAADAYRQGRRDDLWKLAPLYLRPSAAEEKAQG